jgi:hypothetical protein
MKNMLEIVLGFGRMQQNIFYFWKCFECFFLKYSEKTGILIPDLYFTV